VNLHRDDFSWEPFRADLIVNQETGVFSAIREGLLLHPTQLATEAGSPVALAGYDDLNSWVSGKVTDLRLMDMLAWWCFQHP
jgi:hypothetical protein